MQGMRGMQRTQGNQQEPWQQEEQRDQSSEDQPQAGPRQRLEKEKEKKQ